MVDAAEQSRAFKRINVPRLMVVGTEQGVGTSTIALGLLVALRKAGVAVAVGNIGPSLIETTHHRRITLRLAHSFDLWSLTAQQILESFARLSSGAELVLLEGEVGLYDRRGNDCSCQTEAEAAVLLRCPVVLVVNASNYGESIAAVVRGFVTFHPGLEVLGVIANFVKDEGHNQRIKQAVEYLAGVTYLGGVLKNDQLTVGSDMSLRERENPSLLSRNRLLALGSVIQSSVNIELMRELAKTASAVEVPASVLAGYARTCRIAVADDAAFHLGVQDNLDLIRRSGAELVAFSPLADIKLPAKIAGIYLPGGYIHLYAADLQFNKTMMVAIAEFVRKGGLLYAEAGAAAYLARQLVLSSGESLEMVGVLPATAKATVDERTMVDPVWCEVTSSEETLITQAGDTFRGLLDPRWILQPDGDLPRCFQVRDRSSLASGPGANATVPLASGYAPSQNVLASTVYAHFGSNPGMAKLFVDLLTMQARANPL